MELFMGHSQVVVRFFKEKRFRTNDWLPILVDGSGFSLAFRFFFLFFLLFGFRFGLVFLLSFDLFLRKFRGRIYPSHN